MAKVKATYTLMSYSEIINLEDYGFEPEVEWEDISEDERLGIMDSLREEKIIQVSISGI